jgi:hypothetical protein
VKGPLFSIIADTAAIGCVKSFDTFYDFEILHMGRVTKLAPEVR